MPERPGEFFQYLSGCSVPATSVPRVSGYGVPVL
jgi:hypothetical protein